MRRNRNPIIRKGDGDGFDSLPLLGKDRGKSDFSLGSIQNQTWHDVVVDHETKSKRIQIKLKPKSKVTIGLKVNERRPLLATQQYPTTNSLSLNKSVDAMNRAASSNIAKSLVVNFSNEHKRKDTPSYHVSTATTNHRKMNSDDSSAMNMNDIAHDSFPLNTKARRTNKSTTPKGKHLLKDKSHANINLNEDIWYDHRGLQRGHHNADSFTTSSCADSFSEQSSRDNASWDIIKQQSSLYEKDDSDSGNNQNESAYNDYIAEAVSVRLKLERANSLLNSRSSSSLLSMKSSSDSRKDQLNEFKPQIDNDIVPDAIAKAATNTMKPVVFTERIATKVSTKPLKSEMVSEPNIATTSKIAPPTVVNQFDNLDKNQMKHLSVQNKQNPMIPKQKHYPELKAISKLESHLKFNSKELSILRKSSSETTNCEHEKVVNSLISICLLELNGIKMNASSRLKAGLHTGDCYVGDGKKMFHIILENIDEGEGKYLWRVPTSFPDERGVQYSKQNTIGRDPKSHLIKLLKNGELEHAAQFLHDKLSADGKETGVVTWVNLGSLELWQGFYADAVESFQSATNDNEAIDGDSSRQARILALLGLALYGDANFEEANQCLLRALTMLRTKKKGYGCYNDSHDLMMGQIFNSVGCSFFERGLHKSSLRSFLNALHIYLQDIFGTKLSNQEAQSVEFLLNKLKENKEWTSHVSFSYILDAAITFNNLACILMTRKSFESAIPCLQMSLKLQMIAGDQVMNKSIMIATLEGLGKCYLTTNSLKDAEYIYGLILRSFREQFDSVESFHQAKFRAAVILQEIHVCMGNKDAAMKYADLANYHKIAAIDFIKIENLCKKFSNEIEGEVEKDDSDSTGSEACRSDDSVSQVDYSMG